MIPVTPLAMSYEFFVLSVQLVGPAS